MFRIPVKGERKLNRDKRMKNRMKRRNERTSTDVALAKRQGISQWSDSILYLSHVHEQEMLRVAKKDPVGFSSLLPEKYVDFLLDDKLNMAINTKDIFEDTEQAIQEMKLGPLPSFNDTPEEEQLRIENAQLKAELSSTERQLAVLVKPPTWRTLLKEWFMYKVLKRPKPQPLYIGPYR